MYALLIPAIGFIIWAIAMISVYYSTFYSRIDHIENGVGYMPYLLTIFFLYALYKVLTLGIFPVKKLRLGFFTILGVTLLHVLILAGFYSGFPEVANSLGGITSIKPSGLVLFGHILSLLFYPVFLVFMTRGVGFTIGHFVVPDWREIDMRIRVPVEITLGFFVFVIGLLILGATALYTLSGLLVVLALLTAIGFLGHKETFHDIRSRTITLENHDPQGDLISLINPKLLSIEFGYFFLTFLLGVALINVIRPMPIGWDDLGVYMNFPKMMATSGEYLKWAGMYSWQLITGSGFLFSYTAAQAFYVNQLGGILAVIAIISTLSYAFAESGKKSLISLPVLFAAIYYAMPMTVFQQAKDMKLDPAYLFFAISGFMLLFSIWKSQKLDRKNLSILLLVGVIIGFTFSVKFTSLMLIIGVFWLISYRTLSLGGYIGFFFAFLAIFTQYNLWTKLFIWMPVENISLMREIVLGLSVLSILGFVMAWFEKWKIHVFRDWLVLCSVFAVGLLIALAPWLIKNTTESISHVTLDSLLNGAGGGSHFDYTKLYTPSEYDARQKASADTAITSDGQSQNEDLSRYFGQEKGINNYMKLPVNLTFQKNQSGEFTDITYIFLLLVPASFLFVRSRFRMIESLIVVVMLFVLVYCFFPGLENTTLVKIGNSITAYFTKITLPLGYAYLIGLNLLFVIAIHFFLSRKDASSDKLRDTMMFMGLYAFLFWLSAFGIVWYGIVIYFGFFLIIGFACSSFLTYSHEDEKNEEHMGIITLISLAFFLFIATYFVRSAFPHGWNNLRGAFSDSYLGVVGQYTPKSGAEGVFVTSKDMLVGTTKKNMSVYMQRTYGSAGFNEYKYNILTQDESIFANRSDYLLPIAAMNLKDPTQIFDNFHEKLLTPDIATLFSSGQIRSIPIAQLHSFITQNRTNKNLQIASDLQKVGQYMYRSILYPTKETENLWGIYRIGTFMTYLINKNQKRYYDDSLVFNFQNYFYDPSPEVTIERMKKFGLNYLLVDLNAATIDQDARHALTTRFENLLMTMTAKNLSLVSTDNFCLEFALSERKKGKLSDRDGFIDIAGTNFESYRNGSVINRNQKLSQCQDYIVKRINEGADADYPILGVMKKAMDAQNTGTDLAKQKKIVAQYVGQSYFALFTITDLPAGFTLPAATPFGQAPTIPVVASGSTQTNSWTPIGTATGK